MASSSFTLSSLLPLLLLLPLCLSLPLLASAKGGFSIELIHRDSPKSPLYDPSKTFIDRLREAARLSVARADHLHRAISLAASDDTYQSRVTPNAGNYLMEVNVGTPANKIFALVDTGSDLTWTDCKPCKGCNPQVAFDPTRSSTYHDIICGANTCGEFRKQSCRSSRSTYPYSITYTDGSHTSGNLASETFTFNTMGGRHVQIPKVVFGCSHESQGTSVGKVTAGLVGLGGGPLSLVSQLGSIIHKKFSYCLVPYTKPSASSQMSFGANAVVSGPNVVSTPLIKGQKSTFHLVSLKSLTVDGQSVPADNRHVMVDSGTTLTMLDSGVVRSLEDKLKNIFKLPTVKDPHGLFDLCFDIRSNRNIKFPFIVFQFDGAAVKLKLSNTYMYLDENNVCLTIIANRKSNQLGIIGSLAQQNFHIGYDLENRKISFAPTDCTKF